MKNHTATVRSSGGLLWSCSQTRWASGTNSSNKQVLIKSNLKVPQKMQSWIVYCFLKCRHYEHVSRLKVLESTNHYACLSDASKNYISEESLWHIFRNDLSIVLYCVLSARLAQMIFSASGTHTLLKAYSKSQFSSRKISFFQHKVKFHCSLR